jgi:ketosteroid isomerase-like protein
VLEQQQERSPHAELAGELHGVARGPVLDDLSILETADDDASQLHRPSAVGAMQGPARGDPVALGDLFLDLEAQVREELQIQRDRPARALGSVVFERVDMVYESRTVDLLDARDIPAGANLLQRAPRGLAMPRANSVDRLVRREGIWGRHGAQSSPRPLRDTWLMPSESFEIVRRAHEALNSGDIDALVALCDAEFRLDMSDRVFNPAVYEGHDGIRRFYAEVHDVWESYVWEPEELIQAGPDVVALLRSTGRGRGSGVEVDRETAMVWSVREGRATAVRFFRDRDEALLGVPRLDEGGAPASPTNGS